MLLKDRIKLQTKLIEQLIAFAKKQSDTDKIMLREVYLQIEFARDFLKTIYEDDDQEGLYMYASAVDVIDLGVKLNQREEQIEFLKSQIKELKG